MSAPKVTVCLGSCRPGGIDIVFSALARQTYDDFEVLFVDGRYRKRHERVMAAAWEFGLVDKVGAERFMHVPNHRSQPEGSLWTTPAAGYNTSLMLAAGELVVFMMDYSAPGKDWLAAHVKAHEGGPRLVMGPYRYFYHPILRPWDAGGPPVRSFSPGDATAKEIVAQRERFDEIGIFDPWTAPGYNPRRPTATVPVVGEGSHRQFPEGFLDVTWCHTKNESFPRQAALAINGFPEWYDRICGPGDIDFGYQLGQAGLQGWCGGPETNLDAIDMRWVLTNGSIVVPKGAFSKDPGSERRPYYDLGDAFYRRRRSLGHPINNHYDLRKKSLEIWDWRVWGATGEACIPDTAMRDEDYFPEWHTEAVERIARGEAVTL